jgi:hypothetical protein
LRQQQPSILAYFDVLLMMAVVTLVLVPMPDNLLARADEVIE